MVAETPTDGRCNHRVVDNVGLEVELEIGDEQFVWTDQSFDIARLVKDSDIVDAEANYESVRKFLWDDYEVQFVGLDRDTHDTDTVQRLQDAVGETEWATVVADNELSAPDSTVEIGTHDDLVWFDVASIVENVTNRTSTHQGYCERYPMGSSDNDYCYVHDVGAPKGNTNNMSHGMYVDRSKFYNAVDDEDRRYINALVDSWLDNAPFDRDNTAFVDTLFRCAIDQLKAWRANDEYIDKHGGIEGLVTTQTFVDDGETVEMEDEQPVNMAYSRLTDDVRKELKDLGIRSDPESKKAEATESLAKKISGLADE